MKIKSGFVVREIAGESVVVALGEAAKVFNGIIKLNATARMIWDMLAVGAEREEVILSMTKTYGIDRETAEGAFDRFAEKLKGANLLE